MANPKRRYLSMLESQRKVTKTLDKFDQEFIRLYNIEDIAKGFAKALDIDGTCPMNLRAQFIALKDSLNI